MKAAEKQIYQPPQCELVQLQGEGVIAASPFNLEDPPSLPSLGD